MAHTYHQHLFHLVWSTKERRSLIPSSHKRRLWEYLAGAFQTAECAPIQIGGMSDHIHVLLGVPPKHAVSEIIRDIKLCSSKWIRATLSDCQDFAWQEGFGSFTVSVSQKEVVARYILNQEEHHKKQTFKEEFLELLRAHSVEYDEAYLWR
jgi:putative transposase